MNPAPENPTVALLVTCLVDAFRPTVGFASLELLERAGVRVRVPQRQTCCGQPNFNNGDDSSSRALARAVIEAFDAYDLVVVPSGSCAGMLKTHYPGLFEDDVLWAARVRGFAAKVRELSEFLVERGVEVAATYKGKAAYHDSCSSLREMAVREQPRSLLSRVEGLEVRDLPDAEVCCGFGGTFCLKYADISTRLVSDKVADIKGTGADTLLAGDLGCLMNIAGRLKRQGSAVRVFHYAEVLAGMAAGGGIGAKE